MQHKTITSLILILLTTTHTSAQKFSLGSCQAITSTALTLTNLGTAGTDVTWYEYARSPSIVEHSWKCVSYVITEGTVGVANSWIATGRKFLTNTRVSDSGTISLLGTKSGGPPVTTLDASVSSYLSVKRNSGRGGTTNYQVLAVSNALYMVLYGCTNTLFGKVEKVLVLTNVATPSPASIIAINTGLAKVGYSLSSLVKTYVRGCTT